MKNNNKIYKIIGIILTIVLISFLTIKNEAFATDSYYYTRLGEIGTSGTVEIGNFSSKEACLVALKKVDISWKPSTTCYLAKNVTITNFSPSSGKSGDMITITGTNFTEVTNISIGGVNAIYIYDDNINTLRFTLPASAITGKIIVTTKNHGSSTSTKDFTVSTVLSDVHWWYNSVVDNKTKGPFTKEKCEAAIKTNNENTTCFQETTANVDKDKKESEVTNVTSQNDSPSASDDYDLLAPIGDYDKAPKNIGDYFNTILEIAIGLCAVLAVVMIVIGGVQYMGNESIFGKTEAKSQITKSILGLFIAIGAFALLNTIDPNLLGKKGLTVKQVSAEIDEETETAPWEGSSSGDNTDLCPAGFENISVPWGIGSKTTLNVCKSIKPKVVEMLNAAKNAGIILSGSGSRTKAEQQALRVKYGCSDPSLPSNKCTPPTARPGHSMHESGNAIDFRCNDQKMASSSECFKWLSKNASTYGFKNLKSEPWHWSTTGH